MKVRMWLGGNGIMVKDETNDNLYSGDVYLNGSRIDIPVDAHGNSDEVVLYNVASVDQDGDRVEIIQERG